MKKRLISTVLAYALAASSLPAAVLPVGAAVTETTGGVVVASFEDASKWTSSAVVSNKGETNSYLRVYDIYGKGGGTSYTVSDTAKAGDVYQISFKLRTDSINSGRIFQMKFADTIISTDVKDKFIILPTEKYICDANGWYSISITYTHSGSNVSNPQFLVTGGDQEWFVDGNGTYIGKNKPLNAVAPFDIDDVTITKNGTNLVSDGSFDNERTLNSWRKREVILGDNYLPKTKLVSETEYIAVDSYERGNTIIYSYAEGDELTLEPGTYRLTGKFRMPTFDASPVIATPVIENNEVVYYYGHESGGGKLHYKGYCSDQTVSSEVSANKCDACAAITGNWTNSKTWDRYTTSEDKKIYYYYKSGSHMIALDPDTQTEYTYYNAIYYYGPHTLSNGKPLTTYSLVEEHNDRSIAASVTLSDNTVVPLTLVGGSAAADGANYLFFDTEWTDGAFEFVVEGDSASDAVTVKSITLSGGALGNSTFAYAIDDLKLEQMTSTVVEEKEGMNAGILMVLLAKKKALENGTAQSGTAINGDSSDSMGLDGTWSTDGDNTVNTAAGEKNSYIRVYNVGHHYGAARYTFPASADFKANTTYTVSLRLRHSAEDSLRGFRINLNGKQVMKAFFVENTQYWDEPLVFTTTLGSLADSIYFQITGDTWGYYGGKNNTTTLGYSSMIPFDIDDLWIVEGSYTSVEGLDPKLNLVQGTDGWSGAGDMNVAVNGYGTKVTVVDETPYVSVGKTEKTGTTVTYTPAGEGIALTEGTYTLSAKLRTAVYNANPESHVGEGGIVHYAGYNTKQKVPADVSVCETCANAAGDWSKLGGTAYAVVGDTTYYYKKGGHVIAVDTASGEEALYYNNLYLTTCITSSSGSENWSSGGILALEQDANARSVKVSASFADGTTVELPLISGTPAADGDSYLYFDTEWTDGSFELTVPAGSTALLTGISFTGGEGGDSMLAWDIDSLKLERGSEVIFPSAEWLEADKPVVYDPFAPTVIEGDNYLYMAEDVSLWNANSQKLEAKSVNGETYLAASGITSNTVGFTLNTGIRLAAGTYEFEGMFRTSEAGETGKLRIVVNGFVMDLGAKNELAVDNTWTKAKFTLTLHKTTELVLKVCGGKSETDTQAFDMDAFELVKVK